MQTIRVPYVTVRVVRDAMEQPARRVLAHEIPLLEEIHGEGNIMPVPDDQVVAGRRYREFDLADRGALDAEHARLSTQYGANDENVPLVQLVMGRPGRAFVGAIEDAVDDWGQHASETPAALNEGNARRVRAEGAAASGGRVNTLANGRPAPSAGEPAEDSGESAGEDRDPLDADGNGQLTKDEIRAKLDSIGVEYPKGATKAELLDLLDAALPEPA